MRQKKMAVLVLFLLTAVLIGPLAVVPALAHSTKGRIKIPLKKASIMIDDIAYFAESYVHRQLYKNWFEKSKRRFYVRDFIAVEQNGDRAKVRFTVLDNKEKSTFEDKMVIERDKDGIWYFRPKDGGERVEIYTYVRKWGYYYNTYVLPISIVGIAAAAGLLGVIQIRKRVKRKRVKA
jgi:hypothetical protein